MSLSSSSPWKKSLGGVLAASLLVATGCESPEVVPTADKQQSSQTSRIEGTLVVQARTRGNAVVFLYDADRPPPPQGTGRPIAFTIVPAEQLFGPALASDSPGPFTAPFAFSLVAKGRYTIRGFIDVDSCRNSGAQPCHASDFNPWYGVTSEPNLGDIGGAAVDLGATPPRPLTLEVAEDKEGRLHALTNITVSFSQATSQVPFDRPSFQVAVQGGGDATIPSGSQGKILRLTPQQFENVGPVDQRGKAFLVSYVDPARAAQQEEKQREVWPRVVVRKLAEATGLLEDNDLDRNGVLDATGTDYSGDGRPDLVVLRAGIITDGLIPLLTDTDGKPRTTPVPVSELMVGVTATALDASNPAAPVPLAELPKGRYSVVLIQSTGQTWRVPNELSPAIAPVLGTQGVESQAFVLEVP
ncbi:putative lipoprotein [Myxococcus stipitatus DSM 14675]|uniref:Putative lipoprotein n=1 Tax=Myxococcus stipitatus (strain DSM 14675 / JCM 12634 / Mx s8) TaxID=1278073 RepID=L7UIX4_MYXSD|nr:hypothetical protein [Myxococcus stipitatus]AGC47948.1 putative lipoprotein [Myxococcus stipitatus DSM 14675]